MRHWAIIELGARRLPLRRWRAAAARHAERCPACARRLASREEARRLLVQAGDVGRLDGLRERVRRGILESTGPAFSAVNPAGARSASAGRPVLWRYAAAAGGILAAAALAWALVRSILPPSARPGRGAETGFRVHYARIDGRPAETYVIKPPDDGMIVVWVERKL